MNCQDSALAHDRRMEMDAARAACLTAGVQPDAVSGFLARYGARRDNNGRPGACVYTAEQRAALDRYNAARDALKTLHHDYVLAAMRAQVERTKAARAARARIYGQNL